MTSNFTKEELRTKTYHVVESGFQVLPQINTITEWQTVTDTVAVMIKNEVYCTQKWLDFLRQKT